MSKKLKKGTLEYNSACADFAMAALEELSKYLDKNKYSIWVHMYIDIFDCLQDIRDNEDEMLEAIEDELAKQK